MGEEHHAQMVGGEAGVRNLTCVLGEDAGFVEERAEGEPFLVAALPPLGDILLGDGPALELCVHHFDDGGIRIQPFDEAVGRFAIGESGVKSVPNFERETGNFTITSCHIFSYGFCVEVSLVLFHCPRMEAF